jgi:transglutaminase-like putative cysteine protease
MAVKIALSHKTTYTFDRSVKLFPHVLGFVPQHTRTAIEGYTFKISPENHFINWQQDPLEIIKPVSFFQTKLKS